MTTLDKDYLIGKWNLVSFQLKFWGRKWNWGKNATGFIEYDSEGKMQVDIKAEKTILPYVAKLIFHNRIAYGGRYTIQNNQVIHHLDYSLEKSWIGIDQVREILQLDEHHLVLKAVSKSVTYTLVWSKSN